MVSTRDLDAGVGERCRCSTGTCISLAAPQTRLSAFKSPLRGHQTCILQGLLKESPHPYHGKEEPSGAHGLTRAKQHQGISLRVTPRSLGSPCQRPQGVLGPQSRASQPGLQSCASSPLLSFSEIPSYLEPVIKASQEMRVDVGQV